MLGRCYHHSTTTICDHSFFIATLCAHQTPEQRAVTVSWGGRGQETDTSETVTALTVRASPLKEPSDEQQWVLKVA